MAPMAQRGGRRLPMAPWPASGFRETFSENAFHLNADVETLTTSRRALNLEDTLVVKSREAFPGIANR